MKKGLEPLLDRLKHIKKDYLLIGILTGVLMLVIAMPSGETKKNVPSLQKTEEVPPGTGSEDGGVKELEQKLIHTLEAVEGVGKVEVMLTRKSSGERIVEKDKPVTDNSTTEEDKEGGVRNVSENTQGEETVYEKDADGNQVPYVVKEMQPEISGVLIVAQGGGEPVVVNNITEAVMSLFNIQVHKIKVMKMN